MSLNGSSSLSTLPPTISASSRSLDMRSLSIVTLQSTNSPILTEFAVLSTTQSEITSDVPGSSGLTYVVITVGVLTILTVLVLIIVYIFKQSKMDRIRHHLMPLYNFDPNDEEPHWETDLLEDDREQQMALNELGEPQGNSEVFVLQHSDDDPIGSSVVMKEEGTYSVESDLMQLMTSCTNQPKLKFHTHGLDI